MTHQFDFPVNTNGCSASGNTPPHVHVVIKKPDDTLPTIKRNEKDTQEEVFFPVS